MYRHAQGSEASLMQAHVCVGDAEAKVVTNVDGVMRESGCEETVTGSRGGCGQDAGPGVASLASCQVSGNMVTVPTTALMCHTLTEGLGMPGRA